MMKKDIDRELSRRYCAHFGKMSAEMVFVTADQLKRALVEQFDDEISGRPHRLIGRILFEHGLTTLKQIDTVLDKLFNTQQ